MMTSSEWEVEMEYERRFAELERNAALLAEDRKNLWIGVAWGFLFTAIALGIAWGIVVLVA